MEIRIDKNYKGMKSVIARLDKTGMHPNWRCETFVIETFPLGDVVVFHYAKKQVKHSLQFLEKFLNRVAPGIVEQVLEDWKNEKKAARDMDNTFTGINALTDYAISML